MASILIVEDEAAINELVKRNLQLVGHQCTSVFDGKAAVSEIQHKSYDLMILDIMLPGLDGFAVIKQAKETPVIFLTAKSSLPERIEGFSLGADDYLTKPFEMLELLARVEAVLQRTQSRFEFNTLFINHYLSVTDSPLLSFSLSHYLRYNPFLLIREFPRLSSIKIFE